MADLPKTQLRPAPILVLLALLLACATAAAAADDTGTRLALQACRWPERYARCQYDCTRQERKIERIEHCEIDISPDGRSTCPKPLVAIVRQCDTECRATYCPQPQP